MASRNLFEFEDYPETIEVFLRLYDHPNWVCLKIGVPNGFEKIVRDEITNLFQTSIRGLIITPGHIYFHIPISQYEQIPTIRSIDYVYLVAQVITGIYFTGIKCMDLNELSEIAYEYSLLRSVRKWTTITGYCGNINPTHSERREALKRAWRTSNNKESLESSSSQLNNLYNYDILKYKIFCCIINHHSFKPQDVEQLFARKLNQHYGWIMTERDYDLEIIVHIIGNKIMILLKIPSHALHCRTLQICGPVTLRPTEAYCMLSVCKIKPGEMVVDPLSGSGSIGLECAHAFNCMVVCGDNDETAIQCLYQNVLALPANVSSPIVFQWNSQMLPYTNNEVDVICTDFVNDSFGRHSLSDHDKINQYIILVNEFARVLRAGTGRATLYVHNSRLMKWVLGVYYPHSPWHIVKIYVRNINNRTYCVFHIRRKRRRVAGGHRQ